MKILRYMIFILGIVALGLTAVVACNRIKEADKQLAEADKKIKEYTLTTAQREKELETVSLSYKEWQEQQETTTAEETTVAESTTVEEATEPDIYSMDVWTLGEYLYGIPAYDTTRSLILITFEGYGAESPLSYYVACCCWVRATEGYWGYDNLFSAFGELDTWNYGEWLDSYGYADYAIEVLRQCYLNPTYVRYCNGMTVPYEYIYYENGIYVWN